MNTTTFNKSQFKGKIQEAVKAAESIRSHPENPRDVSFADILQDKHQVSFEGLLSNLGIDPAYDTISNLVVVPDMDVRWIIPEVFRAALLLGYRAAPIYPHIISTEEQMKGLRQVMPHINMSDAAPRYVGEGETIPLGAISYGSKEFSIFKIGRGIKLTDEVVSYSSLNVVSIFMRDFGVKLGHAVDVLAIDCLINGEQSDGSESAAVIGVATADTLIYKDLLRVWIRLGRIGRVPTTMLGGEDMALDTLDMDEFKTLVYGVPQEKLTLKSPIPANSNFFIHGNIPADQLISLDPSGGIIKFNGWPLKMESERIVSNQTEAFYVTLQTGFAKLFRDSSVILDRSILFADNGFPTWMEVDALQNVVIE